MEKGTTNGMVYLGDEWNVVGIPKKSQEMEMRN